MQVLDFIVFSFIGTQNALLKGMSGDTQTRETNGVTEYYRGTFLGLSVWSPAPWDTAKRDNDSTAVVEHETKEREMKKTNAINNINEMMSELTGYEHVEIENESYTPRSKEYMNFIENNGPAKNWSDLAELNITEEDFADGPCFLCVDNAGTITIKIRTRIPGSRLNGEFSWCRRPTLGESHFDYSCCPDWLKRKFRVYWGAYGAAAEAYYG